MNKSELVDAVKERLDYLKEIGVTEIAAPFSGAAAELSLDQEAAPAPRGGPSSQIKDLVGDLKNEIGGQRVETQRSEGRKENGRRDLLGSTRISEVRAKKRDYQESVPETVEPKSKESQEEQVSLMTELPESNETLSEIRDEIGNECQRCQLCEKRTQVVNSIGSEKADLMVIGEAPGADEDLRGEPFVGRAGKLLTKILEAIDFEREDVFIGNINRCRPPKNRQPTLEESATCKPFLLREIAVVRPKVIVVLGNTATKNLLETKTGITKLRGNFQEFMGVKVMPTFHPAYLLRDPRKKREVWEDMKKVRDYINTGNE